MGNRTPKSIATVRVKTELEKPIDVEILAEKIKSVADNFDKAISGGLTKRAVALLIHDLIPSRDKVTVTDILTILTYARNLSKHLTK